MAASVARRIKHPSGPSPDFLFASAPQELQWLWVIRVLATAAGALLLACVAFGRREVPYGSD